MNPEILSVDFKNHFSAKVSLEMRVGRFLIKTISNSDEILEAFALRYQVFQVEMIGTGLSYGLDSDSFDASADHLAIFDDRSGRMVATCRLNSSLFTRRFYSEQEFNCDSLIARPEVKLEIGRVCVHRDFRKGAIILILWRAIAEYMMKTDTEILFGCGSVMTLDPREALLLYRHLENTGKIRSSGDVLPTEKYHFSEFEELLKRDRHIKLSPTESIMAEALLPPLCKSYFDMGCYAAGFPAVDYDFKCIDFLTVLEKKTLDHGLRKKMFGS